MNAFPHPNVAPGVARANTCVSRSNSAHVHPLNVRYAALRIDSDAHPWWQLLYGPVKNSNGRWFHFPEHSVPAWDAIETEALREVFGSGFESLACSVPRTQFGYTFAAARALDTICALLALQTNIVPPTANCETPNPDYCPPALIRELNAHFKLRGAGALVCARGSGGSHAVLGLKNTSPSSEPGSV